MEARQGVINTNVGWYLKDLTDFEFRLVIKGRPFTLKNSKKAIVRAITTSRGRRGRPCPKCRTPLTVFPTLIPSTQAEAYMKDAVGQLRRQWGDVFQGPLPGDVMVNAKILSYRATLHKNDASNLYQAPEDALQSAGVLTDDYQIEAHDGSRRLLDRDNPRVEITLTPFRW